MTDDDVPQGGFTASNGGAPDAIDLELWSLAAADGARSEPLGDAAQGSLREVAADLERHRLAFGAPPLPLPAPRRAGVRWAALALAAAALVIGAVALTAGGGADGPPGVRAMGGLPVDVLVRRGGQPVDAAEGLRAGDELFVRFVAPEDGVVSVAALEAAGSVSVLEAGRPVRRGERYVLDGAAQLDDHRGTEWLVVTLDDAALDERAWRTWLPDPVGRRSARTWVMDVTRAP